MKIKKIVELRKILESYRLNKNIIGLVPTMGAFHAGHLSLINRARRDCDQVVVSLFVNPAQFSPGEDYNKYPREFESDIQKAKAAGVDLLFAPNEDELYPRKLLTHIEVADITDCLCGKTRPGHFQGVALVVAKLFNIIQPDKAYFGEKDWQQLKVVERMVYDLNFPVEIVPLPVVRDKDGLALSSRNQYLNQVEKRQALVISEALKMAADKIKSGQRYAVKITGLVEEMIAKTDGVELEYFSIRQPENLTEVKVIKRKVLLAIAVRLGKIRLIDNILVEVSDNVSDYAKEQNPSGNNYRG